MTRTTALILTLIIGFAPVSLEAQQNNIGVFEPAYDTWKIYSSHRSVTTIEDISASIPNALVASTTGGFYIFRKNDNTITFNKGDGKYAVNSSAMTYDPIHGRLWFGYDDGTISYFELSNSRFRHFNDISRNDRFLSNRINDLSIENNILYVATDFGVVLFDLQDNVVRDSYSNLGRFASSTPTKKVAVANGVIYAGTDFGIAVGDAALGDLKIAGTWQNYDNQNGFVNDEVEALASIGGILFASSENINYRFDGNSWSTTEIFGGSGVVKFRKVGANNWYVVTSANIYTYLPSIESASQLIINNSASLRFTDIIEFEGENVFATTQQGIGFLNSGNNEFEAFQPNSPSHNLFEQFSVSASGDIVGAASSTPGQFNIGFNDTGFYIFNDGVWENFNITTNETLRQNGWTSFFRTVTVGDNYFFGLWGGGVVRYNRTTGDFSRYNNLNSPLVGLNNAPNYYVAIGMSIDRKDSDYVWSIAWLNNQNPLSRYRISKDEWEVFPVANNIGVGSLYRSVFVDSYGQKWIPLTTNTLIGRGVLVLRDPSGGENEQYRLTSEEEFGNLPNDRVNAIIQDRRGEVWVGTDRGIGRYIFPDRIIGGSAQERRSQPLINEDTTAFDRVLLRDVRVTAMAVDANNQKWIGSDGDGIYLIEETGRRVIRQFTIENSPLPSNVIKSIAIKSETGEVIISTEGGLGIYSALEREAVQSMESLRVYPNPYSYQRYGGVPIVIENLSDDSTLHILTVDGRLVRRFTTRGGRVEWDGLDFDGNKVSTGVYLIVATGNNNEQRGRGKIVIIR